MQAHSLSSSAARIARLVTPPLSEGVISEGVGLAHDAGNLLGALGLYCDLLDVPGVLRPEHLHYARELRVVSQRSGALIDRLLRAGPPARPTARPTVPDTAGVVEALTPLLRSLAAPHATVRVEMTSELPALRFPAEILERILVNLTRNAATALCGHRPADGTSPRIQIALNFEADCLRLTLSDNGPGMAPQVAAAFLKPCAVVSPDAGARRGLGHRIVHELLQSTDGQLSITVAPGRGTRLEIDWHLPAASLLPVPTTDMEGDLPC